MKTNEKGVFPESEVFFLTPSDTARSLLYYITRCGHYLCDTQYSFDGNSSLGRHPARQSMLLMYLRKGSLSLTLNHRSYCAHAGQAVLIDCLQPHRYQAEEATDFYWMHVDGTNARSLCSHIMESRGSVFAMVQTERFRRHFEELIASCRPTVGTGEIQRSLLIYQLLLGAYQASALPAFHGGEVQEGPAWLRTALEYMHSHLAEPLTVEDIAACAGMSPSHFSRRFRIATAYSPYEYLVLKRIDYAQWFLYATELPIQEIAVRTGYNSETNFIVCFKKRMGITPSRFRRLTKPNQPQNV